MAIGQDSIATSKHGVAVGKQAIATGQGFSRDQFEAKKRENQTAVDNVNNKQNELNTTNNNLTAAQNAATSLTNQINDLSRQQNNIRDKIERRKNLTDRKTAAETELNKKNQAVEDLNTQITALRKNGTTDQYVDFLDLLVNLDWGSSKSEDELATELKNQVDTKFGDVFKNYNIDEYKELVTLYPRREGQIEGSRKRLAKELSFFPFDDRSKDSVLAAYYNNRTNNLNYFPDIDYPFAKNITEVDDMRKFSHEYYPDYFSKNLKKLPPELRNTGVLLNSSYKKLKNDNNFVPFLSPGSGYFGKFISTDGRVGEDYRDIPNFYRIVEPDPVWDQTVRLFFNNYSHLTSVRFGFKSTDAYKNSNVSGASDLIVPIAYDATIHSTIKKLESTGTDTNDFLTSVDIYSFKQTFNGVKAYKEAIDWNFNKSAIDLNNYKTQFEKVEAYYGKIDKIISLYQEIIEERQKQNGGNQELLNQKSRELLTIKTEVINSKNDVTNFFEGIKITYTEEAMKYLHYGEAEATELLKQLDNELRLYDPKAGIIKAVNDKIDGLVKEYNAAVTARDQAAAALNNLNNQLNNTALTPAEEAVDELKRQKEQELAAQQAEKDRLEKEKEKQEAELARLREALAASSLANLGENSYAQGNQAFASGDNSIAIGTQASALNNDAIALGHSAQAEATAAIAIGKSAQVQANAENGVAIGASAVVKHANSVALGEGSTTTVGATAANYAAPIGGDRTAVFDKASVGEVSVGAEGKLRQITHVAAGVKDTDAVNVWQLNQAIAKLPQASGSSTPAAPVVPANPATPSNPTAVETVTVYDVSGNCEQDNQSLKAAIEHMNNGGTKYLHVNGDKQGTAPTARSNGDSSASGRYAVAIGHLANAEGEQALAIGKDAQADSKNSVALGAGSQTTAVKNAQTLGVGAPRDKDLIQKLNDSVNTYAGEAVGVVSVGKQGSERIIQNVAAGLVSKTSTDAVNGSQLHALAQAVAQGQAGLVRQGTEAKMIDDQGVNHNRLTVGAGTAGREVNFANVNGEARRISGVADALNADEAVNKGQLDQAVGALNSRLNRTEKQLKGGIANAVAMASLPQAHAPSQHLLAVGTGHYRGTTSIAFGLSRVSDNGRVTFKLNGSASQKGDIAAGAGIGFAW